MIHINEFCSFDSFYQPTKGNNMSLINTQVQPFKNQAFHNGKFIEVTEANLKGKWSVFIFMPETPNMRALSSKLAGTRA